MLRVDAYVAPMTMAADSRRQFTEALDQQDASIANVARAFFLQMETCAKIRLIFARVSKARTKRKMTQIKENKNILKMDAAKIEG